MRVNDLDKEEVIKVLNRCATKLDFLRYYGYKNNGSGYRFINKVSMFFNIDLNCYITYMTRDKYKLTPSFCKFCGKKLEFEKRNNKFCSRSCAASYNNSLRTISDDTKLKISNKLTKGRGKIVIKKECKCKFCGETFIGNRDFCSMLCRNKFNEQEKFKRWKSGENFISGASGVPIFIRRYLFAINNNQCENCGWGEKNKYTGNIPLAVHHIDGDCTNNREENLQLLCPNCHSLTDNFGALNKESHRFHRNKLTLSDV